VNTQLKWLKPLLFIFLFLLLSRSAWTDAQPAFSIEPSLGLTSEELQWLKAHPVISIGVNGAWPPIDFIDETQMHSGIVADYLSFIEARLGVRFKLVRETSLGSLVERLDRGELNLAVPLSYAHAYDGRFNLSSAFLDVPSVIIASQDHRGVMRVKDLAEQRVVVDENFSGLRSLQAGLAETSILTMGSTLEALQAVSWGKADFFVGYESTAEWVMQQQQLNNLRVINASDLPRSPQHFATLKGDQEWQVFIDIVDKVLANIPLAQQRKIESTWLNRDSSVAVSTQAQVTLTDAEQAWIAKRPVIKVANEEDWPPYDYTSQGIALGYSVSLMELVAEKVGLRVEFIHGYDWDTLYQMGIAREVDVFPALWFLSEREAYFDFSTPYINVPEVIVVRKGSDINTIDDLNRRDLASVRGYAVTEVVREHYPDIRLLEVSSIHEGLRAVNFGQADAFLGSLRPVLHVMQAFSMPGLEVASETSLGGRLRGGQLHIAARNDEPLLIDILQKGLDAVSAEEKQNLERRWFTPDNSQDFSVPEKEGYRWWLISAIGLSALVLVGVAISLPRLFSRDSLVRSFGSRSFRIVLMLAISGIIVLVAVLISITLNQNKKQTLDLVEVNLGVTLQNTVERLDTWANDRKKALVDLGQAHELVSLTKQLLRHAEGAGAGDRLDLIEKTRDFLKTRESELGESGVYIIDQNNINIFAPENFTIGEYNLAAKHNVDLIRRVQEGSAVFIPPGQYAKTDEVNNWSEIPPRAVMFFSAPIRDVDGNIIALLVQNLSVDGEFARILRHGRIGSSGESYALDVNGRLISESRFREQLIDVGLMPRDTHESFSVEVRDPGVNLIKGEISNIPRGAQPYTRMADSVIRLGYEGSGYERSALVTDVSGYRDYRGVPVFGAWIWDFNLGVGITTEIDVEEAMVGHRWLRLGLVSTALVLLVLFIFAMLFIIALGEKAVRSMRLSRDELEVRVIERTDQLQQSESKYRTLFESSNDAYITFDREGFVDCNRAAVNMFGFATKQELLCREPSGLSPECQPDGRDSVEAAKGYFRLAHKEGSCLMEWTHRSVGGEEFPAEVLLTAMEVDGLPITQAIVRDISERKMLELRQQQLLQQADAANQAKSDFLANMSHEIRTPMNAIIGLGHLISRTVLDNKQQDYVNKVQVSAQSLLSIIDDILDFSKIEAGQLKIESIEFSLEDVLGNLSALASARISERPIEFIYSIDAEIPNFLRGDPFRLGQILTNLVTNAVKFTQQGNIILRVSIDENADPLTLLFEVEDNGIGISEEGVAHLFQPFTQADSSTTRRYGGTGLGLSISKQLTEMMGGSIHVESELGKGSRFYFYLPFRKGAPEKLPMPHPDLRGLRVLLVDDNPTVLQILSETLESLSFDVDIAHSGDDALLLLEKSDRYDLILMDWLMPGMDGIETTRRIKSDVRIKHLPIIIMMTAYGREAAEQNMGGVDLDGFLVKPVTPSQLFDAIIRAKTTSDPAMPVQPHITDATPLLHGRVLLAEDNEINQQVAVEILEGMGLQVEVCANGVEALASIEKKLPDFVLMDIHMPKMDGYLATRLIRELDGTASLPIYAMTANAMAGDEEKSKQAGMNGHITKPVDPRRLFDALNAWLPEHKTATAKRLNDTSSSREGPTREADKHENTLPDRMPGLDLVAGIKQVGGNQRLYEKLLREFLINHGHADETLRSHIDLGEHDSAHRLAHTLRGVAGNVGAQSLALAAEHLEDALRQGQDATPYVDPFAQACKELFGSLTEVFSVADRSQLSPTLLVADTDSTLKPGDAGAAGNCSTALNDLLHALTMGDPQSMQLFRVQRDSLCARFSEALVMQIEAEIDDFELEAAASHLKQAMVE